MSQGTDTVAEHGEPLGPVDATTQWRRPSRWWIAAVPVAIATMLVANGYRVSNFWYYSGQHHEIAQGLEGRWTDVQEQTEDAHGELTRAFSVRLGEIEGDDTAYVDRWSNEFALGDGMVARSVTLDFRAEPDQVLKSCMVTLVDDEGRSYRVGSVDDAVGPRTTVCVPEETPGPSLAVVPSFQRGALEEGQQPRPKEWTVRPAVAVPSDAKIVEVRISWENPDYVTLTPKD